MHDLDKLINALLPAHRRHEALSATFSTFASLVTERLTAHGFPVPGFTCAKETNRFNVTFAGRSLDFVFSSSMSGDGSLTGLVQCYLSANYPNEGCELVNSFDFKPTGETRMTCPLHGDLLNIRDDKHALQVACQLVFESLSRNC